MTQTQKNLVGLLVGVHFHPPAKQLLDFIPGEAALLLEPEPENPYDPQAIKVLLPVKEIPEENFDAVKEILPSCGVDPEEFFEQENIVMGHVGASSGKPLLKARANWPELAQSLTGNAEFLEAMKDPGHSAKLGFAPTGDPLVILTISEA